MKIFANKPRGRVCSKFSVNPPPPGQTTLIQCFNPKRVVPFLPVESVVALERPAFSRVASVRHDHESPSNHRLRNSRTLEIIFSAVDVLAVITLRPLSSPSVCTVVIMLKNISPSRGDLFTVVRFIRLKVNEK